MMTKSMVMMMMIVMKTMMTMMMLKLIVGCLCIQSMAPIRSRISLDDDCNDEGLDDD